MSLFYIDESNVPEKILAKRNAKKDWEYGWDPDCLLYTSDAADE